MSAYQNMEESEIKRKKMKSVPSPMEIKTIIFNSSEPLVLKNILSWESLNWSLDDWVNKLGNPDLYWRVGTKMCAKEPQWENECDTILASLKQLVNHNELSETWMYFDYKHMKHHFKDKTQLLESFSWADFGFPNKSGKDSTIWIGTKGAYTPCHMDSYGCNVVAQVHGRKQWVLFPPSNSALLKPTRVPYEESSIYSSIHFGCGLNDLKGLEQARVVEVMPGDVLIVPRHWWHYVENLTTAISVNMWIPLESDHTSRLEESLVRYFVALNMKNLDIEGETTLLNPNEMDLMEETVDIRQISWCLDQVLKTGKPSDDKSQTPIVNVNDCISPIKSVTAEELQQLILAKCGCKVKMDSCEKQPSKKFTIENVINAFCHPDVISKVAEVIISSKK